MKSLQGWLVAVAATAVFTPFAWAHFRLIEPQSWLIENNLGDPQKMGPCGGTPADSGSPSNAVNRVQGGQMSRIVTSGSGGSSEREFTARATR